MTEPKQPVYAYGTDAQRQQHIVREYAQRRAHDGRIVVDAECGQLVYCPRTGPWPRVLWSVCAECAAAVAFRGTSSMALGDAV